VPGYFRKIKAVCERHDVLLVLDEVMAGMGRTGQMFAYADDGILPDMVAVGKGLAAGYMPISALLISDQIHSVMAQGSGVLGNGQTHVNHPLAYAIALEVQQVIAEENLLAQVRLRGEQMRTWLTESLADLDIVGDVRGRGLFIGVEFVESRVTKAPFRGGGAYAAALKKEALERGLLIYPGSGTAQGVLGNHVLFAPPFITSEEELSQMIERFSAVVKALAH
jgi:adenosylmethionine-8-amino-7-oxononanoate aminotransferase